MSPPKTSAAGVRVTCSRKEPTTKTEAHGRKSAHLCDTVSHCTLAGFWCFPPRTLVLFFWYKKHRTPKSVQMQSVSLLHICTILLKLYAYKVEFHICLNSRKCQDKDRHRLAGWQELKSGPTAETRIYVKRLQRQRQRQRHTEIDT